MALVMQGKDAVFAALAECYVTIDGRRLNFMQAIDLEAKMTKNVVEVPILGRTTKGIKAVGWKGEGTATFHFNSSTFRSVMKEYAKTGMDFYFEIQITNNDPMTDAGSQTVVLKNCNLTEIVLAKFDADGEYLDEELSFTFDDWELETPFNDLPGMQ